MKQLMNLDNLAMKLTTIQNKQTMKQLGLEDHWKQLGDLGKVDSLPRPVQTQKTHTRHMDTSRKIAMNSIAAQFTGVRTVAGPGS